MNSVLSLAYRFDAKSQRLEGADFYLHRRSGDEVLLLTIERIEYDQPIDPVVFSVKLPDDVQWVEDPKPLAGNERYEKMTPKQAARAFFAACAKREWDEAGKFYTVPWSKGFEDYYGGLQIVSIGEPFQSARDVGKVDENWIVPFEVKLQNGRLLKHNLGLRKDSLVKRHIICGGL